MVYEWKLPGIYNVSAQKAGEELERIYTEHGKIEPKDVVDESRSEDAVLHPCFEWRDDVAAEKYREEQARTICRNIVIVAQKDNDTQPTKIRAMFHVQGSYHPTQVIVKQEDKYTELCRTCLQELSAVRKKFSMLSNEESIKAIFNAIDEAVSREKK